MRIHRIRIDLQRLIQTFHGVRVTVIRYFIVVKASQLAEPRDFWILRLFWLPHWPISRMSNVPQEFLESFVVAQVIPVLIDENGLQTNVLDLPSFFQQRQRLLGAA